MTDAPELPARPPRTGQPWLDMVVSVCALFMSGVSIFMANQNSSSMENLVHANSWPFLQMGSGNAGPNGPLLALGVTNAGTGPARIHSYEIFFDGVKLSEQGAMTADALQRCCATAFSATTENLTQQQRNALLNTTTSPVARTFLRAGDEAVSWQWAQTPQNAALWTALDQARQHGRLVQRACYCSVFDECWVAETDRFPPRRVASCSEPAGPPDVSP